MTSTARQLSPLLCPAQHFEASREEQIVFESRRPEYNCGTHMQIAGTMGTIGLILLAGVGGIAQISSMTLAVQDPGAPVVRSQLLWVDRGGQQIATLGGLEDYGNIELSPAGDQVAVALMDNSEGTRDIWLYDVVDGSRTRITSNPADENWMIWSSDGSRVVFNRFEGNALGLYQTLSDGTGAEELLISDADGKWPVSWSPDGEIILYVTDSRGTGNDLWALPLSGDRRPFPIFQTPYAENWASFSPDGRWIAFSSNDSGRPEIYVTPYPPSERRWRISAGGGSQSRWRSDGEELFYMAPDLTLMAVGFRTRGSEIEVSAARALFEIRPPRLSYRAYHPTDGERFLVNRLIITPGRDTERAE